MCIHMNSIWHTRPGCVPSPPWMWMALQSRFVCFESIEMSPPLTASTALLSPSQQ